MLTLIKGFVGTYLTKILLVLLGISLALTAGLYASRAKAIRTAQDARTQAALYKGSYEVEKRAVEALKKSAESEAKALKSRAEQAEQAAHRHQKQTKALREALKKHKAWADTRIPQDVRNALKENAQ